MQVALHFGAPYTDENRLQLCLGKNRDLLAEHGTIIPRPSSYRKNLRPVLNRFKDGTGDDNLRMEFVQEMIGDQDADRIVISYDMFIGVPRLSIAEDQFFPGPFNRLDAFMRLFDGADVQLFYGLRNPATFVQQLISAHPGEDVQTLLGQSDPMLLRWSDFVHRIREDFPNLQTTFWCNEDTPLIWGQVVRELAGIDPEVEIVGEHDFIQEIMTKEGFKRFEEFLSQRPGLTTIQKRRVIAAFLDKFVDEDALEEELDFPGWTDETVEHLTEVYDQDVFEIQNIPGVRFISP